MHPSTGPSPWRADSARRGLAATRFWAELLLGLLAFVALASAAHVVPYFEVDLAITRALQSPRLAWTDAALTAVSWVGFPPQSNVIFGALILALALAGRRWSAAVAFLSAATSAASWFAIDPLVARPRPSPDLVNVVTMLPSGGFPSGHVLNLTAFFGFLCFLCYRDLRITHRWRYVIPFVLTGAMVALIGLARIVSGEHWPSDVLGGYLLGGIWLALSIHLYRWGIRHGLEPAAPAPPPG